MDNDDDDDGNFTKWMSSYWGHGGGEEARVRKRSFRRPRRVPVDRRASLPCMSQLEAMQIRQLHNVTSAPIHLKSQKEKEVRAHPRARRVASDEYGQTKGRGRENQISTIPELSESFERMLRIRNKRGMSVSGTDNLSLICKDLHKLKGEEEGGGGGGGGGRELNCAHRFYKEVQGAEPGTRPRSGSSSAVCGNRKELAFCAEPEAFQLPRHRFSLRRQR